MKRTFFTFLAFAGSLAFAQPPAPPPPPPPADMAPGAPAGNVSGSISQFNYGPDGRVEGFVIAPNTLVSLPPDWAMQVEMLAKRGDSVKAAGALTTAPSGMQLMNAQTLTVAGRTLSNAAPSAPAPYAGSGSIRQLNYDPQGQVNGFVLQNGVIARTPPFGASDASVVKTGATISFSGFTRTTPAGKTVVDVQSISVNGQTIALGAMPGGPPAGRGPGRGPGGRRGLRDPAPPPPPSPPAGPRPPQDR